MIHFKKRGEVVVPLFKLNLLRILGVGLIWLLAGNAFAKQEIITLQTREDGDSNKVSVSYLLETPDGKAPQAILLAFPQGEGNINLEKKTIPFKYSNRSQIFMRDAALFTHTGMALALLDKPSDHSKGFDTAFRANADHIQDITATVKDLSKRFPGIKVYLAAPDIAGVSILHAAMSLKDQISGIILLGGAYGYSELKDFDYARIKTPILIIHHTEDECNASPIIEAKETAEKFKLSFVAVSGGQADTQTNSCYPTTKHGFFGSDQEVANIISGWITNGMVKNNSSSLVIKGPMNEQVIFAPMKGLFGDTLIETTIFKPDGPGPFPLLIINHGTLDPAEAKQKKLRYRFIS